MTQRLQAAQKSNQWWISQLIEAADPGVSNRTAPDIKIPLFTPDQIRAAANLYLSEYRILPADHQTVQVKQIIVLKD